MSEKQMCIRDHRRPGWFWAANEIVDVYGARIGTTGIAVYMALARHTSERDQTAWPSVRRLATLLGTGFHQVLDALDVLEREGLIQVHRTSGQVNVYILLDVPAGGAAAAPVAEDTCPGAATVAEETVARAATVAEGTVARAATDRCQGSNGTVARAATEQNTGNNTQRTTQQCCVASESLSSELLSVGVAEATADELARSCTPGRVREVLDALARQHDVTNRAGWVVSALRENWDVAGPATAPRAADALRAQVVNCAFRRSPAMGQCPSEEEEGAWMPWCRGCERCPGGSRPPGNEK